MKIIARILLITLALFIAAAIVPGVTVGGLYTTIIAAIILGLLNVTVKPILQVLTLPITILTLGLFAFIINAGIFLFAASFVQDFDVDGFLPALLGSLIVTIVSTVGNTFLSD